MEAYRTLARDLASARELLPGNVATAALESAYTTLHAAVGRPPRFGRARLLALFRDDIPAAAASVRATALWIALLLAASALAGWWLISTYPELIGLIASEKMIDGVEHGHLWTDQLLNVAPSSVLSMRIFSNNVVVTAGAFCAGLFFGLGTLYMITLNGLMLGGLLAFTHQYGLGLALLRFILAHGPVELSVICLAGAAGTALGGALIWPTAPTRAESFRRCAARLGPLLVACALLLLGSGLIEGFISPDPRIPIPVRLVVGLAYWVLMLLMLSGRLFPGRKERAAGRSA
ncbi:MAG: stage II sporulation protein M, partial [Steroidobacteraceae bacterium]